MMRSDEYKADYCGDMMEKEVRGWCVDWRCGTENGIYHTVTVGGVGGSLGVVWWWIVFKR